ncbi:MAG: dihydropteroate synthase [Lachnospiraceae bacterium]|jgi:dihydropteroate synthase|nr:dihydropteroate synthase [Lachnospiraceae bacterium]
MRIGNREFETEGTTYILGILNVTPDSFSDGGRYVTKDAILHHAGEMIRDGASMLDIGGMSTRPGHADVDPEEESCRVTEAIRLVKDNFDIPVSLDTFRAKVAKDGIAAGADLINDIWGLRYPEEDQRCTMADVIASGGLPCILMDNATGKTEGNYAPEKEECSREAFLEEVNSGLSASLAKAEKAGIRKEKIILDPGVGFGRTYRENLWILGSLGAFRAHGCPLLLGASRKSVIGQTLDLPAGEREEGTEVTTVLAVQSGCMFVRVHNVLRNARAAAMAAAIGRA